MIKLNFRKIKINLHGSKNIMISVHYCFIFPLLTHSSFPVPKNPVTFMPLGKRYFSKPPLPTSLPLHTLRWAMFTITAGSDRSSFFPLLLFSYLSRLPAYLQSIAFLPRNQSTKGIRSSGMMRKWVACTYPIRIQGRPHTHTYYILSAIACMYTPSCAIFLKRPWNCCLGNRHIVFQLSYSFSSTQVYKYGFLLVICMCATF